MSKSTKTPAEKRRDDAYDAARQCFNDRRDRAEEELTAAFNRYCRELHEGENTLLEEFDAADKRLERTERVQRRRALKRELAQQKKARQS